MNLFAQTKSAKSETYKDIIEKAYNLSLQKDRQQALKILASAITRETRPQAIAELKKTAQDISTLFFSDKSQQLYETGISLRKTDPAQGLTKITEAQRLEPENSAIVNELAKLLIIKGDCSAALDAVTKQLLLIPYDDELRLSQGQSYACLGQWIDYQRVFDAADGKHSSLQKYWLLLEIDRYFKVKNYAKTQEILTQAKKLDPKYPEFFYWSWKIDQALLKKTTEEAQKYVMTCKNISASQYRQYMIDPMLCRRLLEVETELKGINGNAE